MGRKRNLRPRGDLNARFADSVQAANLAQPPQIFTEIE
jgi:hypothetical protein